MGQIQPSLMHSTGFLQSLVPMFARPSFERCFHWSTCWGIKHVQFHTQVAQACCLGTWKGWNSVENCGCFVQVHGESIPAWIFSVLLSHGASRRLWWTTNALPCTRRLDPQNTDRRWTDRVFKPLSIVFWLAAPQVAEEPVRIKEEPVRTEEPVRKAPPASTSQQRPKKKLRVTIKPEPTYI